MSVQDRDASIIAESVHRDVSILERSTINQEDATTPTARPAVISEFDTAQTYNVVDVDTEDKSASKFDNNNELKQDLEPTISEEPSIDHKRNAHFTLGGHFNFVNQSAEHRIE